jgi:hypothetical protein
MRKTTWRTTEKNLPMHAIIMTKVFSAENSPDYKLLKRLVP